MATILTTHQPDTFLLPSDVRNTQNCGVTRTVPAVLFDVGERRYGCRQILSLSGGFECSRWLANATRPGKPVLFRNVGSISIFRSVIVQSHLALDLRLSRRRSCWTCGWRAVWHWLGGAGGGERTASHCGSDSHEASSPEWHAVSSVRKPRQSQTPRK